MENELMGMVRDLDRAAREMLSRQARLEACVEALGRKLDGMAGLDNRVASLEVTREQERIRTDRAHAFMLTRSGARATIIGGLLGLIGGLIGAAIGPIVAHLMR